MSDPMSDASLSSSRSHGEEEEEEDDDEEVGDGVHEEELEAEDEEDDDAEEDEEEEDEEGESMEMANSLLHTHASTEEAERLHSYGEGAAIHHQKQNPHEDEDDEDDDMDSDQAFMERDDFDSANELATLADDAAPPASTHHTLTEPDYDAAAAEPLASEDLLLEKDDIEADAEADAEAEVEEEEEEDGEPDFLDFLKRPPEEDDGTPEEQREFVQVLERFFAERKMEYKHPKFYQENLNCLKLWRAVVRLGGYEAVTTGKLWRQVGDTFKPPKSCTTVSWSFRIFYEKALLEYERYKFRGLYPGYGQGAAQHDIGAEAQADAAHLSSSQPGFMPNLGRARRDAASRAMQGWHSQRLFGNGDVGDPIIKEKAPSSSGKRAKQLKMGLLRKKKAISFDRAAQARNKSSRSLMDAGGQAKDEHLEEVDDPSYFSAQRRKPIKQDHAKLAWKRNGCNSTNGDDIWVADEGPEADWVKINVHKMRDCFEVYALVPGLLREEVRIQCEPGGQLVIVGEPEERNNPWGITSFKKVINLPLPIDASQTSAVVTVQGQLFVRVPFDLTHS